MLIQITSNARVKLTRDLSKYHTRYVKVGGKLEQQVLFLHAPSLQELADRDRMQRMALAVWG